MVCGLRHTAYHSLNFESVMTDKVKKDTYQKQVYNILEKMILTNELGPGKRLVELELATSLGVSRSPVREAILYLEQEGLVRNTRGAWFVSEVSIEDISDLYDLRKLIEVYAGKVGCLDCPEDIINEMKSNAGEFENEDLEVEVWREKNRKFHELIVLSCGNKKMYEVFVKTMKSLWWCSHVALALGQRRRQSISEHKRILEAFLEQDPELVEKAIREHIEIVQNNLRKEGTKMRFVLDRV